MNRPVRPLGGFPFPLNVGTDICAVYRISAILMGPHGSKFLTRIFAAEEVKKVRTMLAKLKPENKWKYGDVEAQTRRLSQHVAGRFAAKEAVIKAHSFRKLYYSDVVIEYRSTLGARECNQGSLIARIKGKRGEPDTTAMVSVSHEDRYATAVCLASDPSVMEDLPGFSRDQQRRAVMREAMSELEEGEDGFEDEGVVMEGGKGGEGGEEEGDKWEEEDMFAPGLGRKMPEEENDIIRDRESKEDINRRTRSVLRVLTEKRKGEGAIEPRPMAIVPGYKEKKRMGLLVGRFGKADDVGPRKRWGREFLTSDDNGDDENSRYPYRSRSRDAKWWR